MNICEEHRLRFPHTARATRAAIIAKFSGHAAMEAITDAANDRRLKAVERARYGVTGAVIQTVLYLSGGR